MPISPSLPTGGAIGSTVQSDMAERNRQWLLARRPQGLLSRNDLTYRETTVDPARLPPGHIRVRNLAFLCAPTMRNWMEDKGNSLYPSMPLGMPVMAPAGAEIIESTDPRFPVGAKVSLLSSWQDYETIDSASRPIQRLPDELGIVDAIGRFGLNSVTAYFGLLRVGEPRAGETLLVSGAAGSTGAVAAQIGKLAGCRVVGIAGGETKCSWLTEELGLDAAVDYRAGNLVEAIRSAAPEGIDVFFDNVGGEILQAAVEVMNRFGRIVLCGQIAGYNDGRPVPGLTNMMRLIYGSIRLQGFLMGDYREDVPQALSNLRKWEAERKLTLRVDTRHGFENLPDIFNLLFSGTNSGTLVADVASG